MFTRNWIAPTTLLLVFGLLLPGIARGQGIFLQASGAVNRGMGGATTGTAIESIGSMYWNPATIGRLPNDELAFGFEAIYTNYQLSSTFPGVGSGSSDSEIGATPVPTIAWVHHTDNPYVTFGLGVFGVAGFATNFRADPNNPILSPPFAQGGVGVGGFNSQAMFFQLNPAWSLQLTERLSVGVGPVLAMAKVTLDENAFAPLNADGRYPRGDSSRYHWGLGAQLGVHYVHDCCWEFGANVKSPTWFESFRYFAEDEAGLPRTDEVDMDLPMIVSGGVAYRGLQYTVLTADIRYFDYTSTEALGDPAAYDASGRVRGLGWDDQFSVALGAQCQLTSRLTGRVGYIFCSHLIDNEKTFFNLPAHLGYQHIPTIGATYDLSPQASFSLAYNYLFEWETSGPYVLPGVGEIPGSNVKAELDTHIATLGVNVRY
jgi:long-chain fatty acid transport protein